MDLVGIEPDDLFHLPWKRAPSCATGPRLSGDLLIGTNVEGRSLNSATTFPAESNSDAIYLMKRIRLNSQPGLHMNCRSLQLLQRAFSCSRSQPLHRNQPAAPAPVSYSSVNQLNTLLGQLQQTLASAQATLSRNEEWIKWKTDNNSSNGKRKPTSNRSREIFSRHCQRW